MRASPGSLGGPGPNLPSAPLTPTIWEASDPLAFPETAHPRHRIPAAEGSHGQSGAFPASSPARLPGGRAGKQRGVWKFYGRGAEPHAFHRVLPTRASPAGPTPASSTANAAALPGTGSRWSPGRRISSGLGMEQPHAAATNPNSPAGTEQVGLFIWEELICRRSIRFPPKQCAARCLVAVYII